jgi:2-succinyl-6-hydroxy-2,4-cyclohexadiene-1-carboxylate synthase
MQVSGTGMPIVLLQTWHPYAKYLASSLPTGRQVVTIDVPGYYQGKQKKPITNIDLFSDLLDRVFAKLGFTSVDIIGQCLGGILALHYAARYPERTRRVVVVTPPLMYYEPIMNSSVRKLFSYLAKGGRVSCMAAYVIRKSILTKISKFFGGYYSLTELVSKELRRGKASDFDERVFFGILSSAFHLDLYAVIKEVKAKLLFVAGANDYVSVNSKLERIVALMSDADYRIVHKAKHAVILEQTEKVNQIVLDFLLPADTTSPALPAQKDEKAFAVPLLGAQRAYLPGSDWYRAI